MSSTFFTPLIILVLFNLSSYFYTKLDELTLSLILASDDRLASDRSKESGQYSDRLKC
jgi:hypothetical protein